METLELRNPRNAQRGLRSPEDHNLGEELIWTRVARLSPGQPAHVHEPSLFTAPLIIFGDRRTSEEADLQ